MPVNQRMKMKIAEPLCICNKTLSVISYRPIYVDMIRQIIDICLLVEERTNFRIANRPGEQTR